MLSNLHLIYKEEDEEPWVKVHEFVKLLQKNSHEDDKLKSIRKDAIVREVEKHRKGVSVIDSEQYIPVASVIKYICHHSDQLVFCKRNLSQITSILLTNPGTFNFSSIKEVYDTVAKTQFHSSVIENHLYSTVALSNDDAPTVITEYENNFSQLQWQRILLFENHFEKEVGSVHRKSYPKIVDAKWKFLNTLEVAKDLSKRCQLHAKSSISEHYERRKIANKDDMNVYIKGSNSYLHDASLMEQELMTHHHEARTEEIKRVICIDCTAKCNHSPGVHVILELHTQLCPEACRLDDIIALTCTYLSSKHDTECCEVAFCKAGSLKQYLTQDDHPERFHLHDAIQSDKVHPIFTWTTLAMPNSPEEGDCKRCDTCYPASNVKPLAFNAFRLEEEWVMHIPLVIQILMESFLNPRSITGVHSQAEEKESEYLTRKLQRLYFTYDILLNVFNKQHVGLLQERNTYELIMGSKSVTTVFHITTNSGATMSFRVAEIKLKERATKELCYFNTYKRYHHFQYQSVAGPKVGQVRISDCPVKCLLLDNLVRLRYHSDPKPGEHRSQQMCTMPITIKGVPADEEQLVSWHNVDCDMPTGTGICSCMKDIAFTSTDASLPTILLPEESSVLQRFQSLCTWGTPAIWAPLKNCGDYQELMKSSMNTNDVEIQEASHAAHYGSSHRLSKTQLPFVSDGDLDLSSMIICSDSEDSECFSG